MKLYIIQIDERNDGEFYPHEPVVCLTKEEAAKELRRLRDDVWPGYKEAYGQGARKDYTKGSSFEVYLDGEECLTHYSATVNEVDIPSVTHTDKFVLRLACGRQCSYMAADQGWKKAEKKLDNGELEGFMAEYEFQTEKDRRQALEIIEQCDGWLDHYCEAKKSARRNITDPFKSFEMMPEAERKEITDSNLLESGVTVAQGKTKDGFSFRIFTDGDVRILWKNEVYKYRKDFPDDLVEAIKEGSVVIQGGEFAENNWYELSVCGKKGELLYSELYDIDISDMTEDELKEDVFKMIEDIVNKR